MNLFDELYSNFTRDLNLARGIVSPNHQDTIEVKIAMVGFSYNAKTEDWGIDEFDYVNGAIVARSGLGAWERLYYLLVLGYLLGVVRTTGMPPLEFKAELSRLRSFIKNKIANGEAIDCGAENRKWSKDKGTFLN